MSGALCAAAASSAAVDPPLVVHASMNTGITDFNVTGASGDMYAAFGIVQNGSVTGGSGSYSITDSVIDDGGTGTGSVGLVAAGDHVHNTPGWSGMAVGDTRVFHLQKDATDTGVPPQHASDRFPPTGQAIALHRIS